MEDAGMSITGFNLWSLIVAVIGAVILIAIFRAFRRPSYDRKS